MIPNGFLPAVLVAAVLLTACGAGKAPVPRFADADCRTVEVSAPRADGTLRPLVGIEDIAQAPDGSFILSAYDRLAAQSVEPADGTGGIYRWVPGEAVASPVATGPTVSFPHGIDLSGERLIFVARRYTDGFAARVLTIEEDGRTTRLPAPVDLDYCAANDVAVSPRGTLVTLDREACPGWSVLERLGLRRGRLVRAGNGRASVIADGLSLPNGVLDLGDETIVAETRGRRLTLLSAEGETIHRLSVPGGPDNLTRAPDGRIVAALHPDLISFARYRYGHRETAPSRVVAVDPRSGAAEWLYDDEGDQFPGATVAQYDGTTLIAGSVRAPGLLVCKAP